MDSSTKTELDILGEIVQPGRDDLSLESARAFLELRFSDKALERLNSLVEKNRLGTISDADRSLLDKYLRVGDFLNLLHAKARLSLVKHQGS